MNEHPGHDIYKALKDIEALYGQVALLLRTADAYMTSAEHGFKTMFGSTSVAEGSASIKHPDQWYSHAAFRFFTPPQDDKHVAAWASVILCPFASDQDKVKFTEPLVSVGWTRYPGPVVNQKVYWWSRLATYTPEARDGAKGHYWKGEDGVPGMHGNIEEWCMATPLMEIKDSETLVKKMLTPLVDSLNRA